MKTVNKFNCKEVNTLLECETFKELEGKHDDRIFYADGELESVTEAMEREPKVPVEVFSFNGWFVGITNFYAPEREIEFS